MRRSHRLLNCLLNRLYQPLNRPPRQLQTRELSDMAGTRCPTPKKKTRSLSRLFKVVANDLRLLLQVQFLRANKSRPSAVDADESAIERSSWTHHDQVVTERHHQMAVMVLVMNQHQNDRGRMTRKCPSG